MYFGGFYFAEVWFGGYPAGAQLNGGPSQGTWIGRTKRRGERVNTPETPKKARRLAVVTEFAEREVPEVHTPSIRFVNAEQDFRLSGFALITRTAHLKASDKLEAQVSISGGRIVKYASSGAKNRHCVVSVKITTNQTVKASRISDAEDVAEALKLLL